MPSPAIILSALFLLVLFSDAASAAFNDTPTVYEELERYNFPVGLLPVGVKGYDLDKNTGKFKVYLPETCTFSIQGYDLKYKSTISGVISENRLKNLKGISVRILVLWLNIVEVSRNGDVIDFSVGILAAGFPFESFVESPQCGCGFDCAKDVMIEEKKDQNTDLLKILQNSS